MGQITLTKPSGGQLTIAPEDGTSTETVTIPSVGVGKVLQVQTFTDSTFSMSSSNLWIDYKYFSFTPLSSSSTIHVTLSVSVLNEANNSTDLYLDWRGANGQYHMGFGKAGSLSGWNQNNNAITYSAPSGGTTSGNIRIQYRPNGTNLSYINYNYGNGNATSTITIMEVAA